MPALIVHLPASLAHAWFLGEPLRTRWVRLAGEAGLDVRFTDDPEAPLEGDDVGRLPAGALHVQPDQLIRGRPNGPIAETLAEVARLEALALKRLRRQWRDAGVQIIGRPFLAETVQLAPGAVIWDASVLLGRTSVGEGAVVHTGCHLTDVEVGRGAVLKPYTVAEGATFEADASAGPFAHVRPGSRVGTGARVGNFVETKNTTLGPGAKANHLTYLGDCTVGAGANVGAGTITCNYDGALKHPTHIGEGAFIGSNSALVAPVRVGDQALVGAGSTITQDVPDGGLAIARGAQRVIEGKGRELLERNQARKARAAAEPAKEPTPE